MSTIKGLPYDAFEEGNIFWVTVDVLMPHVRPRNFAAILKRKWCLLITSDIISWIYEPYGKQIQQKHYQNLGAIKICSATE